MMCASGLNDFSKKCDLNLNSLTLDCYMVDSVWLNFEKQSTITICSYEPGTLSNFAQVKSRVN